VVVQKLARPSAVAPRMHISGQCDEARVRTRVPQEREREKREREGNEYSPEVGEEAPSGDEGDGEVGEDGASVDKGTAATTGNGEVSVGTTSLVSSVDAVVDAGGSGSARATFVRCNNVLPNTKPSSMHPHVVSELVDGIKLVTISKETYHRIVNDCYPMLIQQYQHQVPQIHLILFL
jgi:hypothetical protein